MRLEAIAVILPVSRLPSALFVQPPDLGRHLDAGLVRFGGLGWRRALDFDAVALPDPAHLGVHQAGNAVFARQDAEMRAHRAAGADHAFELFENRRGQRAAAVVDDGDRIGGDAGGEQFEHALARADIARNADQILRVFDDIVADSALLAALGV